MKTRTKIALALAVCGPIALGQTQVVLKTNGWPFRALPTAEQQAANPADKAYATVLQTWLGRNAGVRLEGSSVNVWDQQVLLPAVAGGTAPAFYPGSVLGNWNDATTRSAYKQGLAADVTDLLTKYSVNSSLASYARPAWEKWRVDGRYYGLPDVFVANVGVYYRRDLVRQLGLKEPRPGWTWDDFRALAKGLTSGARRGAVMPQWTFAEELRSNQFNALTKVAAPETGWNWRWDFTSNADRWTSIVNRWRRMVYGDKSVLLVQGGQEFAPFQNGDVAMMIQSPVFYSFDPSNPQGMAAMAAKLKKPVQEVVGWVELPRGDQGVFGGNQPVLSSVAINPDLKPEALDKAVGLYRYMYFGDGYVKQKQAVYERTKDLRYVYTDPFPVNGLTRIPGVPGSFADAWGREFQANLNAAVRYPLIPNEAWYIPAETAPGPTDAALQDALSKVLQTEGAVDIAAEFARAERTMNQQAASFRSSVDDARFKAAARQYYADLSAFWQKQAPQFYAAVLKPWYDRNAAALR